MIRIEYLSVVALLASVASGCDGYGSSDKSDAVEAQQQADLKIADERREAAEKRAEIRTEVSEKTSEIREDYNEVVAEGRKETAEVDEEANANIARAQAGANEKIREANRETTADESELGKWSQAQLDSLNAEIDDAKVKAQKGKVAMRRDFNAGIAEIEVSRDRIASDLAAAGARGEDTTEKLKKDFDTGIQTLKTRVDVLSKKL